MFRRVLKTEDLLRRSVLTLSLRSVFQSKEFQFAVQEVPKTPGGKNPYDILGVTITKTTTWDDLNKVFREKVREVHPDHGGSNEAMAELNAAKTIIKDNHEGVIKRMENAETQMKADRVYGGTQTNRRGRDEKVAGTGGIHRKNVRAMNQRTGRTVKEVEKEWAEFKKETEELVTRMCSRYEYTIDVGRFFRKSTVMTEITVRERWLRKTFIKGVWETVHELRGDLLKKGARNAQQAQLAEDMVAFAGMQEKKLNQNFQLLTQLSFKYQARFALQRFCNGILFVIFAAKVLSYLRRNVFNNTLSAKFGKEF